MRQGYDLNTLFHRAKIILPSQYQPIIFPEWDEEPALKELRITQTPDPAVNPEDKKREKAPSVAEMIQHSREIAAVNPAYPEMEPFNLPPSGFVCPFIPRG